MGGGRSIQLARVLGVRIGVDPSWFIVLFLVIWSLSGSFKNVYPGHDTKAFFLATLAILSFLAFINVALLVLNLVPGFPLDGGRIARSIVWWRTGDRDRATRFAAALGRAFGYLLIGFGLYLLLGPVHDTVGGIWSMAIGFMLSQSARAAVLQSQIVERVAGLRVADVMDAEPVVLPAQTKLDRALDEFFLRYRWPWFPVVDA